MNKARKKYRLRYGWGINDVSYSVYKTEIIAGKQKQIWVCPYYQKWCSIIQRSVDVKFQEIHPTYKDCTICEEWKYLSNFIKWVDSQPNRDWQNCCLDKDFLIEGNKKYSPETVVFIPVNLNNFIISSDKSRGGLMMGVCSSYNNKNPYQAYCRNPFQRKGEYLGVFHTELDAHLAWQAKKHEHALRLADEQTDPRVAKALRERYAPDKDWTNR